MAGRPKDGGQPLTSLSIRISTEMKAELEARARRQRRTTSDYVKLLLEKVLSEPEPEREYLPASLWRKSALDILSCTRIPAP